MPRGDPGFTAVLLLAAGVASTVAAGETAATTYRLGAASAYEEGCQPPCLCPILLRPMTGGFLLVPRDFDGLFWHSDLEDVRFVLDGPAGGILRGRGHYLRGGEFAAQHRLTLDLADGAGKTEQFDSGLVLGGNGFPAIDIAAAVNGFFCWDRVVDVQARPALALVAGADGWTWSAAQGATGYDVVGGDLGRLRESGGDFAEATVRCVAGDVQATATTFDEIPKPDNGWWLVLRYRTPFGVGSYDADTRSQVASRDPGIAAAPGACR